MSEVRSEFVGRQMTMQNEQQSENERELVDPYRMHERPHSPGVDDERLLAEAEKFSVTTAGIERNSDTPIKVPSSRRLIDLDVPDDEVVDLTPLARHRAVAPGAEELAECVKRVDRCERLIEAQVDVMRSLTNGVKANAQAIRHLRIALEEPQTESQSVQAEVDVDDVRPKAEMKRVPTVIERAVTAKPELAGRSQAVRRKGSAPDGTSTVSGGGRPNTRSSKKRPHSLTQAEVERFILRQRKEELSVESESGPKEDEPTWSAIAQVFRPAGSDHQSARRNSDRQDPVVVLPDNGNEQGGFVRVSQTGTPTRECSSHQ